MGRWRPRAALGALRQRVPAAAQARWERLRRRPAVAVLVETAQRFGADECATRAAAIAYYALFSLFPLAIGLTALTSWVLEALAFEADFLALLVSYLPGAEELLRENVAKAIELRGPASIGAVVGLVWSARAVFAAMLAALNRAWDVAEPRPFLLRTLVQVGLVLAVALFFFLSVLTTTLLRLLLGVEVPHLGWRPFDNPLWQTLATLLPLAMSILSFLILYRFVPNAAVLWSDVWAGALLAAALFELAKSSFVWYTQNLARFELVYGSLSAVVALLLWAYVSGLVLLLGAELSAAHGRRRRRPGA